MIIHDLNKEYREEVICNSTIMTEVLRLLSQNTLVRMTRASYNCDSLGHGSQP